MNIVTWVHCPHVDMDAIYINGSLAFEDNRIDGITALQCVKNLVGPFACESIVMNDEAFDRVFGAADNFPDGLKDVQ